MSAVTMEDFKRGMLEKYKHRFWNDSGTIRHCYKMDTHTGLSLCPLNVFFSYGSNVNALGNAVDRGMDFSDATYIVSASDDYNLEKREVRELRQWMMKNLVERWYHRLFSRWVR